MRGEVLEDVFLDEFDTEIGIVDGLYLVANTADYERSSTSTPRSCVWNETVLTELVSPPRLIDKLSWCKTSIVGTREHGSGLVKGTTEAGTDGQETRCEGRDEIFACARSDDGVHCTRDGGAVIGSQHEDHLNELGGIRRKTCANHNQQHKNKEIIFFSLTSLEPQQTDNTTNTDILFEHI